MERKCVSTYNAQLSDLSLVPCFNMIVSNKWSVCPDVRAGLKTGFHAQRPIWYFAVLFSIFTRTWEVSDVTVKPLKNGHSKYIDETNIWMTTGSLMKGESIAKCKSGNWSWNPIFGLFESDRFTQVLLFCWTIIASGCFDIWWIFTIPIRKSLPNSRIKPQMYVRHSIMYEKAAFCKPDLA